MGLVFVEQLYRNVPPEKRWALKFLCLGLGVIFAYDFFLYSHGLLFRHLDPDIWSARGAGFRETWTLFSPYNVGSVVIQWAVVLVVLISLNRFLVDRTMAGAEKP